MYTMQAELRSTSEKAKHIRQRGLIPGCLYGGDLEESMPLQISQSEVNKLLKQKDKGSMVALELDGKKVNALLREISCSSVKNQIEHLGFQKLNGNELVTSAAQIVLINKEKIPVYVQQVLFDVPYKALASKLIEKVEIDLEGMQAGDSIKVKDLDIANDKDIEILIDTDSLVVSIIEKNKPSEEITQSEEE